MKDMNIKITQDLELRKYGIIGEYSVFCPYCGTPIVILAEFLKGQGHFCYSVVENCHTKHLIDEDYLYLYSKNPFIKQILKEWVPPVIHAPTEEVGKHIKNDHAPFAAIKCARLTKECSRNNYCIAHGDVCPALIIKNHAPPVDVEPDPGT